MRKIAVRPWNVKPGDIIRITDFQGERHATTVKFVEPTRGFITGERAWIIHFEPEVGFFRRTGHYYRDQRVEVERV